MIAPKSSPVFLHDEILARLTKPLAGKTPSLVLLTGARACGKTTVLRKLAETDLNARIYLDLQEPSDRRRLADALKKLFPEPAPEPTAADPTQAAHPVPDPSATPAGAAGGASVALSAPVSKTSFANRTLQNLSEAFKTNLQLLKNKIFSSKPSEQFFEIFSKADDSNILLLDNYHPDDILKDNDFLTLLILLIEKQKSIKIHIVIAGFFDSNENYDDCTYIKMPSIHTSINKFCEKNDTIVRGLQKENQELAIRNEAESSRKDVDYQAKIEGLKAAHQVSLAALEAEKARESARNGRLAAQLRDQSEQNRFSEEIRSMRDLLTNVDTRVNGMQALLDKRLNGPLSPLKDADLSLGHVSEVIHETQRTLHHFLGAKKSDVDVIEGMIPGSLKVITDRLGTSKFNSVSTLIENTSSELNKKIGDPNSFGAISLSYQLNHQLFGNNLNTNVSVVDQVMKRLGQPKIKKGERDEVVSLADQQQLLFDEQKELLGVPVIEEKAPDGKSSSEIASIVKLQHHLFDSQIARLGKPLGKEGKPISLAEQQQLLFDEQSKRLGHPLSNFNVDSIAQQIHRNRKYLIIAIVISALSVLLVILLGLLGLRIMTARPQAAAPTVKTEGATTSLKSETPPPPPPARPPQPPEPGFSAQAEPGFSAQADKPPRNKRSPIKTRRVPQPGTGPPPKDAQEVLRLPVGQSTPDIDFLQSLRVNGALSRIEAEELVVAILKRYVGGANAIPTATCRRGLTEYSLTACCADPRCGVCLNQPASTQLDRAGRRRIQISSDLFTTRSYQSFFGNAEKFVLPPLDDPNQGNSVYLMNKDGSCSRLWNRFDDYLHILCQEIDRFAKAHLSDNLDYQLNSCRQEGFLR